MCAITIAIHHKLSAEGLLAIKIRGWMYQTMIAPHKCHFRVGVAFHRLSFPLKRGVKHLDSASKVVRTKLPVGNIALGQIACVVCVGK